MLQQRHRACDAAGETLANRADRRSMCRVVEEPAGVQERLQRCTCQFPGTAARLPPSCPCVRGGEDRADSLIQVVRNYAERPSFAEFCVCMAEGEEQWPHWGFILCSCYLLTGAKISLRFCSKASKRTVKSSETRARV